MEVSIDIEIPFFDVDCANVAWHGHYVKYFSLARSALFDKFDFDLDFKEMEAMGFAWPVVDMRIKYIKPARFKQIITVTATLAEYENRVKVDYVIVDKETKEKLTTGYTIQVTVDLKNRETCFVSPKVLMDKLKGKI